MQQSLQEALTADLYGFDLNPFPTSDADPLDVAAMQLKQSLLKKWEPNGVSPAAERAAFEKFEAVNARMASWQIVGSQANDDVLLGTFESALHLLLGWRVGDECDLERVAQSLGVGPGNVVGCEGDTFLEKVFLGQLTATSERLVALYRAAISNSQTWAVAERLRCDKFGFSIVDGCRLFFAPKYAHIARTCSTQPAVNMTLQKGVDGFILDRLAEWGINLSRQADLNKELSRRGSVDGSFSTIDLSSASDCVSLALGRMLPQPLQRWVFETRTSATSYRGKRIELGMVSMMGNGYTFSLQTAIFASIVKAAYDLEGLPFRTRGSKNWGVFGDDIIVEAKATTKVLRLLSLLGFEVNVDKTFHTGHFRESCGADWFKGYPVRGVYLRRLRTDVDRYSAINRLNRWSARHGVPLVHTVSLLLSEVRNALLVPPAEADTAGIHVPFVHSQPTPVTDRYEHPYRALAIRQQRVHLHSDEEGNIPPCAAVAVLGGYLSGSATGLNLSDFTGPRAPAVNLPRYSGTRRQMRDAVVRTKILRSSTPWWDWLPGDVYAGVSHGQFATAVAGNLLL